MSSEYNFSIIEQRELEKALRPEDIGRLFVRRINAGDVEGLVALYESNAVLITGPDSDIAIGRGKIRDFYSKLLTDKPRFEKGEERPPIQNGDLALTSSRLKNGIVTAEVARRQPDGSWLWIIDQPMMATETANNWLINF